MSQDLINDTSVASLHEEDALALLLRADCTAALCQAIARNGRLTSFYSVRCRLVEARQTPQHISLQFVPHLYWMDLLRISADVRISPVIRRAAENRLLGRLPELSLGEKISTAKACSRELLPALMKDPDPRVFEALLQNPRLTEDDVVIYTNSDGARPQHLSRVAENRRWAFRPAVRLALATNPQTPRAVAASQLRHLSRVELRKLLRAKGTSTYLRTCIERLLPAPADEVSDRKG